MIQKNTIMQPADSCGVIKTRVFHLYKGSKGRFAFSGDFLKVSIREVKPDSILKKKSKHRSIIVRTLYKNIRKDGSNIIFKYNSIVLLKKRLTPRGKTLKGPISRNIRRRKFLSSFSKSL
jgi:large subunit ribosomal protein L14